MFPGSAGCSCGYTSLCTAWTVFLSRSVHRWCDPTASSLQLPSGLDPLSHIYITIRITMTSLQCTDMVHTLQLRVTYDIIYISDLEVKICSVKAQTKTTLYLTISKSILFSSNHYRFMVLIMQNTVKCKLKNPVNISTRFWIRKRDSLRWLRYNLYKSVMMTNVLGFSILIFRKFTSKQ